MNWQTLFEHLVAAVAFVTLGIVLFVIALKLIVLLAPFSVRKELEEDQNVALGIVIGAIFVGLAIIVAAAVNG